MKGGAEFIVGRDPVDDFVAIAPKSAPMVLQTAGAYSYWDGPGGRGEVCYRNFRRAADKPIPKGKRARVLVTVEVLEILED